MYVDKIIIFLFYWNLIFVKFGTDEETFGPLLRAKFHPIVATIRVYDPQN